MTSKPIEQLKRMAHHAPTVVSLVAIAALAVWGHQTGWKLPKASASHTTPEAKEDWCEAHGVPDSRCIACHPELAGGNTADWCKEHGVPESKCTVCHPEILTQGKAADWCNEHGVPESQCTLCHPEIAVRGKAPPSENPVKVTAAPDAASAPTPAAKNPMTCQTHAIRVQFASLDAVKKAGVSMEPVQERRMADALPVNAEVNYEQTRVAHLSSRLPGSVWRADKEVGQHVRKGAVLALVDSADVGRAKAAFMKAIGLVGIREKAFRLVEQGLKDGVRSQMDVSEADAALREATVSLADAQHMLANLGMPVQPEEFRDLSQEQFTERVRFLGIPADVVKGLQGQAITSNLIAVTAPFDSVVAQRDVVSGEVVDPTKTLFVIADPSHMWVTMNIPLESVDHVEVGQKVIFHADAKPDETSAGKVFWIDSAADERTRTVKARARVDNSGGKLRANTFGTAKILLRETATTIAIPDEAIQWEGCCFIAFVHLGEGIFQTRKVKLGAKENGYTEVLVGVLPGEVIAVAGSHVLKSEVLKSSMGAGCVDD